MASGMQECHTFGKRQRKLFVFQFHYSLHDGDHDTVSECAAVNDRLVHLSVIIHTVRH